MDDKSKCSGEPVAYVMSEDEVYEALYDVAVSHLDSNGINVIEPEILGPLIRVLAIAVNDEAGFAPQPAEPVVNQSLTTEKPSLMEVRHLWGAATEHTGGDGLEAMQHFAGLVLARFCAQQPVSGADGLPESPTRGMTLGQRIAHVGGRENAQGYVEFGSPMAVDALIQHVLRDLPKPAQPKTAGNAGDFDAWITKHCDYDDLNKAEVELAREAWQTCAALAAQASRQSSGNPGELDGARAIWWCLVDKRC